MIYNNWQWHERKYCFSLMWLGKGSFYLFLYCRVCLISPLGSLLVNNTLLTYLRTNLKGSKGDGKKGPTLDEQQAESHLILFKLLSRTGSHHRVGNTTGMCSGHRLPQLYSSLSALFLSLLWLLPVPNQVMFLADQKTFSFLILDDFS